MGLKTARQKENIKKETPSVKDFYLREIEMTTLLV
jgi:hypothetical protein